MTKIKLMDIPEGNFLIDPINGKLSIETRFKFNISNWRLPSGINEPFKYKIFIKFIEDNNQTLILAKYSDFFRKFQTEIHDLRRVNVSSDFGLPYFGKKQKLAIVFQVYSDYVFKEIIHDINIEQFDGVKIKESILNSDIRILSKTYIASYWFIFKIMLKIYLFLY